MAVGCPFITCAVKKKGLEFCWDCKEHKLCEKWKKSRDFSRDHDSILCRQKLEDNIFFILRNGIEEFEKQHILREQLLKEMLQEFNEGRSKNYYCISATILEIEELKNAISRNYYLKLRK
jgi:hypothetical protein